MISLIDRGKFEVTVSAPLVLEYESAGKRLLDRIPLTVSDLDDILDYICEVAHQDRVYYLWRPVLPDPRDEMVLELAVAAGCDYIVTYNEKDFVGAEKFGVQVLNAKEFLRKIGELP